MQTAIGCYCASAHLAERPAARPRTLQGETIDRRWSVTGTHAGVVRPSADRRRMAISQNSYQGSSAARRSSDARPSSPSHHPDSVLRAVAGHRGTLGARVRPIRGLAPARCPPGCRAAGAVEQNGSSRFAFGVRRPPAAGVHPVPRPLPPETVDRVRRNRSGTEVGERTGIDRQPGKRHPKSSWANGTPAATGSSLSDGRLGTGASTEALCRTVGTGAAHGRSRHALRGGIGDPSQ